MYERKNSRLVIVDGQTYLSVKDAATKLKLNSTSLYNALHNGQNTFLGHKIERSLKTVAEYRAEQIAEQNKIKATVALSKKRCPVKCTSTGKLYGSISEAAREAGVHMWTMSIKMESTGKFIDKAGKEYVRLKPMQQHTNRDYGCKYSEVTRDIKHYTKKSTTKPVVSQVIVPEVKQEVETVESSLLKSATLLSNAKNYTQAANVYNILASLFNK